MLTYLAHKPNETQAAINSSHRKSDKQEKRVEVESEDGSDNDEFIVHTEGHEEIHITRKAKKQLKMQQVAHIKVIKNNTQVP